MSDFETKPDGTRFTSADYSTRHAEVFANRYDDGLGDRKIKAFRRLAGALNGTRLLDVGSGDGTFSIAQFGSTRSINASAAAAIAMHAWVRQYADLGGDTAWRG